MVLREVVRLQTLIVMAELARKTHFQLQPANVFLQNGVSGKYLRNGCNNTPADVCYAGGITELRIIAGMAEAYYSPIATA